MKKFIVITLVLIIFSVSTGTISDASSTYVLSGATKLTYTIPQDDLGIIMWVRAAWCHVNYFDDVNSVYAGGTRYTTSSERSVYAEIDIDYLDSYIQQPLAVKYTTNSMSYTSLLLNNFSTFGENVFLCKYNDSYVNLTGSNPSGKAKVYFGVEGAIPVVQSVTVSMPLD